MSRAGATRRRGHGDGVGNGGDDGGAARQGTRPRRRRSSSAAWRLPECVGSETLCCPTILLRPSRCRRRRCHRRRRTRRACRRPSTTRAGRSIRRRCASRRSTRLRPSPLDDGRGSERDGQRGPTRRRARGGGQSGEGRRRRRHAARPGLGQRSGARHPSHPRRRRLRVRRPRRQAAAQGGRAAAHPRPRDPAGLRGRLDLRARERPHPGDRTRRARAQAVPLSPRLATRQGRRQVRAHARVRRGAAADQEARRRRPRGAGRHEAAPRHGAGDDRSPPRHHLRAHRQRGVRAREQVVRADDAAQSPRGRLRRSPAPALSRQERQGARGRHRRSSRRQGRPALPGDAGPGAVPVRRRGRRGARRRLGRGQRLHPRCGRRRFHGQGLPHLARHGARAGAVDRAVAAPRASRGRARRNCSARSPSDSATRSRSAGSRTFIRACSRRWAAR